jgi:cardiolipin synthase A/B
MRVDPADVKLEPIRARLPDEADWRYVRRRKLVRVGNFVQPLRTGKEAFPAMLAAIAAAKHHVHLETYLLRADRTGNEFKEAMIERARAGVRVRLLFDSLGSFGLPGAFLGELKAAGVLAVKYHPLVPWRARWSLNRRDHQKILVIDDEVAFTGGINLGDEARPVEDGGGGWYDVHVRVEGPVVLDLARIFRRTWERSGGDPLPETPLFRRATNDPRFTAAVQAISNAAVGRRWRMHRAYLHAIRRAERSISIMNAYFIPGRNLRRAFAQAVERGVSVRVIVPSAIDVKAVYYASHHLYANLMRHGIRVFEWPERMMHAKIGLIDGVWSTIGSYNLDRRSLQHNLEVGLVIVDRKIGGELEEQFEKDVATCREITLDEWQRRSAWEKAMEWLFYRIRYWL